MARVPILSACRVSFGQRSPVQFVILPIGFTPGEYLEIQYWMTSATKWKLPAYIANCTFIQCIGNPNMYAYINLIDLRCTYKLFSTKLKKFKIIHCAFKSTHIWNKKPFYWLRKIYYHLRILDIHIVTLFFSSYNLN